MTKPVSNKSKEFRRQHNTDLIRRMRNGDSLYSFDSTSSWFPPRPVIDKDPEAIKELYGSEAKPVKEVQKTTHSKTAVESTEDSQVVSIVRPSTNNDDLPNPPIGEAS